MAVGMFLAILDIQIVASSLVDIQFALDIPADRLSYIQTTYLIAEIIAIALSGWLTRVMSTRWLFVFAMCGFVVFSIGCAASQSYPVLYVFRFLQGLFGGAIVPVIFTSVFTLFPEKHQTMATVIGGGLAMLAPTVGPFIGGWITETLSWHWLFLINIVPGLGAAAVVAGLIRVDTPDWRHARTLDVIGLGLIAAFLAGLELSLKEAPGLGWRSVPALALVTACVAAGWATVVRCRRHGQPIVDLSAFADRTFAIGCLFSFILGMALFGAIYLMPLFLGLVRGHGPLAIGTIMIVTGVAQLIAAPVAAWLDRRMDARLMTGIGYALFAAGLAWNSLSTPAWDFDELFWPQVLRGMAVMVCLVPVTRLALGCLPPTRVANASALFNLMRNVGGAVGLALIDTLLQSRPAHHVERIVARLQAGDADMARFVGLPADRFTGQPLGPIDEATREFVQPLVEQAAAVAAFNDGWLLVGALVALSLLALPLMRRPEPD